MDDDSGGRRKAPRTANTPAITPAIAGDSGRRVGRGERKGAKAYDGGRRPFDGCFHSELSGQESGERETKSFTEGSLPPKS